MNLDQLVLTEETVDEEGAEGDEADGFDQDGQPPPAQEGTDQRDDGEEGEQSAGLPQTAHGISTGTQNGSDQGHASREHKQTQADDQGQAGGAVHAEQT